MNLSFRPINSHVSFTPLRFRCVQWRRAPTVRYLSAQSNVTTAPKVEYKAAEYDAKEEFDRTVLSKLADLGAYGLMAPEELEGANLCNTEYARLVNVIDLASGRKIAAYCLTESESGSDVSSIQAKAELSPDGKHYILNGTKIWISNGGFADVFTVFAKTPVKDKNGEVKKKITAFIVERKFGGVTHSEPEEKMGIKASNTVSVYFEDCKVPVENVLGEVGEGFKVAVNILNQGRFGMAAALSGAMRTAIHQAAQHALQRKQFGRKLCEYGNIQEKITNMIVRQYITESMAFMLSGIMDLGAKDYQLEAAISKIYSSESAWYCVDEAIQILGGTGYMRQANLERFLRDLRIFRIFEGANDILRLFISLTGLNFAGKHLAAASRSPMGVLSLTMGKLTRTVGLPGECRSLKSQVPSELQASAALVGDAIDAFGGASTDVLICYKKAVMEEQFRLTRLADSAIHLFGIVCALSRASQAIAENSALADYETRIAKLACIQQFYRRSLKDNEGWGERLVEGNTNIEASALQQLSKNVQVKRPVKRIGVKIVERNLCELDKSLDDNIYSFTKSVSKDVFTHGGVVTATTLGF